MEGQFGGGVVRPSLFGGAYPSAVGDSIGGIHGLCAVSVKRPLFLGAGCPFAVGISGIERLQGLEVVSPRLLTAFDGQEFVGRSIAAVLEIGDLAEGSVVVVGEALVCHPCTVEPDRGGAGGHLLLSGERLIDILVFLRTLPVVGSAVPDIDGCHGLGAGGIEGVFVLALAGHCAVGVIGPDGSADHIAFGVVLIVGAFGEYGVDIEGLDGFYSCTRRSRSRCTLGRA